MTIGSRIKQRRLELGLSQDELAKKCGYKSRSSVNKIELSRDVPLSKVELFARALDVTPGFLMGWEENLNTIDTDTLSHAMKTAEYAIYINMLNELTDNDRQTVFRYISFLWHQEHSTDSTPSGKNG